MRNICDFLHLRTNQQTHTIVTINTLHSNLWFFQIRVSQTNSTVPTSQITSEFVHIMTYGGETALSVYVRLFDHSSACPPVCLSISSFIYSLRPFRRCCRCRIRTSLPTTDCTTVKVILLAFHMFAYMSGESRPARQSAASALAPLSTCTGSKRAQYVRPFVS